MAISFGLASIYLWKCVRKVLHEDSYSLLCRMKHYVSMLSVQMSNRNEFPESPIRNPNQKAITINKTHNRSLKKIKTEPIYSTSNFQDIKGFETAKNDLILYISPFKSGSTSGFEQRKLTKGCILFGPPRFERTILVHALAGEVNMGLLEISCLSLDGSFYCNGKKIVDVQTMANQVSKSPPCILFFDNYDCYDYVNSDFLSSLIIELDKCETGDRTALIVATSKLQNIPRDVANFSRFGTVVQLVDNLNFNKRKEVFLYHMSNIPIDSTIDVDLVISATVGMNARQIKYLVGRSSRKAKLQNRCNVTTQDLCYTFLMEKLKTSKNINRPTFPPPANSNLDVFSTTINCN